ncbi:MAM and LDL-receptor class A domain-containing protein 1-like [Oratosquilla oratoria]|uniref:MAM and LDL-receptor class A domain-containing protein 1-like n=1 Tax=Oratosquilla oratoria TaxID=337810 RepID=UPI003F75F176
MSKTLKDTMSNFPRARVILVLGLSLFWTVRAEDYVEDEAPFLERCYFDDFLGTINTCELFTNVRAFRVDEWTTGLGKNAFWHGGPLTDASNSSNGGYGLIEMSQMSGSQAWLLTKLSSNEGLKRKCLSFNFTTDGLSLYSLEVQYIQFSQQVDFSYHDLRKSLRRNKLLWFKHDPTGGKWSSSTVTYTSNEDHSIAFVAKKDFKYSGYPGYAAVDNIVITPGPCEFDCHFDNDLCHFKNDDEGSGWVLRRGGDKTATGPSSCHLFYDDSKLNFGGCAIFDSAYPQRPGNTARLVSKTIKGREDPICLSFWASMYGSGIGSLSVSLTVPSTNVTKTVWKKEGAFGTRNKWVRCQTPISSPEDFFVTFQATIGEQGSGDIGLDTISFITRECQRLPHGLGGNSSSDCTFFLSSCAWSLVDEESSLMPFLSLSHDPTGHTKYLESSSQVRDKYARFDLGSTHIPSLQTAALLYRVPTTGSYCLRFWFFMHDSISNENELGSLRVIVRSKENKTVWDLTNQLKEKWTKAKVPLQVQKGDMIAIEGTKGKTYKNGKMGVDDITLFESVCEILPVKARVTQQDCTFNRGSCGWIIINSSQDDLVDNNWRWSDGTSIRAMVDKTYNSSRAGYMFLGKEPPHTQLWSQLASPVVLAREEYCLTWYFACGHADFHAHQDQDTRLAVFLKDPNTDDVMQVWEMDMGNATQAESLKCNEWTFAQVALPVSSSPQVIYFEGRVFNSFWAIDDIKLYPGIKNCKKRPTFI